MVPCSIALPKLWRWSLIDPGKELLSIQPSFVPLVRRFCLVGFLGNEEGDFAGGAQPLVISAPDDLESIFQILQLHEAFKLGT